MLDRFVGTGGNFIDTANVYSTGVSEEILGRWLKRQRRDDLVIATKARFQMGDGPNDLGLSRKHLLGAVEASLRRLQTDYLDLYQVHCWDSRTPLEETLSTLNDLVRRGLVRYLGASNHTGWQLQRAIDLSREMGWEHFTCLQPQYNLLCRSTEWELIPLAQREGLGVIPWSPLRGGWLSGKFRRGMTAPPQGSRIQVAEEKDWGEKWSAYNNEHTWRVLDALHEVASESKRSAAQIALNGSCKNPESRPRLSVREAWNSWKIISAPSGGYCPTSKSGSWIRPAKWLYLIPTTSSRSLPGEMPDSGLSRHDQISG